jgi:hypothetical protein
MASLTLSTKTGKFFKSSCSPSVLVVNFSIHAWRDAQAVRVRVTPVDASVGHSACRATAALPRRSPELTLSESEGATCAAYRSGRTMRQVRSGAGRVRAQRLETIYGNRVAAICSRHDKIRPFPIQSRHFPPSPRRMPRYHAVFETSPFPNRHTGKQERCSDIIGDRRPDRAILLTSKFSEFCADIPVKGSSWRTRSLLR